MLGSIACTRQGASAECVRLAAYGGHVCELLHEVKQQPSCSRGLARSNPSPEFLLSSGRS